MSGPYSVAIITVTSSLGYGRNQVVHLALRWLSSLSFDPVGLLRYHAYPSRPFLLVQRLCCSRSRMRRVSLNDSQV